MRFMGTGGCSTWEIVNLYNGTGPREQAKPGDGHYCIAGRARNIYGAPIPLCECQMNKAQFEDHYGTAGEFPITVEGFHEMCAAISATMTFTGLGMCGTTPGFLFAVTNNNNTEARAMFDALGFDYYTFHNPGHGEGVRRYHFSPIGQGENPKAPGLFQNPLAFWRKKDVVGKK